MEVGAVAKEVGRGGVCAPWAPEGAWNGGWAVEGERGMGMHGEDGGEKEWGEQDTRGRKGRPLRIRGQRCMAM